MPQSPPLENTGEHKAMGATAPGQGIKGENASDASQRREYFGGGETTGQTNQAGAGDDISRGIAAAQDSANRAADKYKADKEKRFE
ncbi:hypothetical protein M408DRAFT_331593 [Serendipita vermifera MAFF 305830]|uniref:Uncharacterized protein n=1 Tax=Serendipita vermifera MAFF 305830 TaxID=933852 RepID=A0A0C3AXP9_SERVB|nr:hypothetical protein M408DRAFT_331593 [Serendipita vermifera MAFF 305830]